MAVHPRRSNAHPDRGGSAGAVSGRFDDADHARAAIETLQRKGIEAGDISIEGKAIQRAGRARDARDREKQGVRHIAIRVFFGATLGTILGIIAGAALELLTYGTESRGHLWGFLIGGALAGGVIGGMMTAMRTIMLTKDYELTFAPEAGEVIVAVRSTDDEELNAAEQVLRDGGAADVRRSDPSRRRHA